MTSLTPNNLPLQLTSFIGREQQIAEVRRLLSTSRLLTLTGAGGSGKTRLALQVASQVLDQFPHGGFFVNLAPITDHNLVVSAIAQTLDIKEAAGQPLIQTLKAHLQDKEMLLLLDNFEQVVDAASMLNELLLGTAYLKVLVTSRVVLRLYGEQQYHVPPLQVPEAGPGQKLPPLESLSEYEAVRLFVERAQSARSDFSLTDGNASSVAELCARLDGLPLAIELAAARVRVLTPQAMLPRLERRLKLLTGGEISRPARHQTLRAAIEWSYDLLSEGEKQLFRRMAVFQGGCSLEAVEAVCNYDGSVQGDVLEGVSALVDKNLLQQREGSGGEARFWMLETIHEYAREKLQESGEAERLGRKHAEYFLNWAEVAAVELHGPEQAVWFEKIEVEHNNLRTAFKWSQGSAAEDAEIGLRLGGALYWFWEVRGYRSEGQEWLSSALSRSEGLGRTAARAKALFAMGRLKASGPIARLYYQQSLDIYTELDDKLGSSFALVGLGHVTAPEHKFAAARSYYEQALALRREIGYKRGIAQSLSILGDFALYREGDYHRVTTLIEEALPLERELGDTWGTAVCLKQLAEQALAQGHFDKAITFYNESLSLFRELRSESYTGEALHGLARVALHQKDHDKATALYNKEFAIHKQFGDESGEALLGLAEVALARGDYNQAGALFGKSLMLFHKEEDREGIIDCLEGIAWLAAKALRPQKVARSARLWSAAEALRNNIMYPRWPVDTTEFTRRLTATRCQVDEATWEKAWTEGHTMNMEQAIAYALQDMPEPEPVTKEEAIPQHTYPNELTRREVEVLRLLVEGLSNEQIAERLFLSTNTVRSHLYSIYSKLGVPNRTAATRFAVEHKLV